MHWALCLCLSQYHDLLIWCTVVCADVCGISDIAESCDGGVRVWDPEQRWELSHATTVLQQWGRVLVMHVHVHLS